MLVDSMTNVVGQHCLLTRPASLSTNHFADARLDLDGLATFETHGRPMLTNVVMSQLNSYVFHLAVRHHYGRFQNNARRWCLHRRKTRRNNTTRSLSTTFVCFAIISDARFASLIIRIFQLVFSVGTVFSSHNKSIGTMFRLVFSAKRTRPEYMTVPPSPCL